MRVRIKKDDYNMTYVTYNDRRFYNLTEHEINIIRGDFKLTIPPSGLVLRTGYTNEFVTYLGDIPVFKRNLSSDVNDLPDGHYNEDYIYIVSNKILKVTDKDNFLAPFALIRDKRNRVIGCNCLTNGIFKI